MKTNKMTINRAGYALIALLMGVFTSCSQKEFEDENAVEAVKLTVSVEEEGVRTRSTDPTVDRYVIEVYTDNAYSLPAGVFTDGKNKAISTTGEFALLLDRTKDYYCLIWADKAGSTCYTVSDLKTVTLVAGQKPAEAWHGTLMIPKGTAATLSTELKRAVSKLSLLETGVVLTNSVLTVSFNRPTIFNVATAVSSNMVTVTDTLDLSAGAAGTTAAPLKLNTNDIFVLASVYSANVTDLTFSMVSDTIKEPSFNVTNVPFQANYSTTIKGHYTTLHSSSFTLMHSELWNSFDE